MSFDAGSIETETSYAVVLKERYAEFGHSIEFLKFI